MTPASLRSRPRFTELLAALVLLIVVVALLYGHTLGAYWRSDDGAHLKFAVDHSPWQYFFDPVVTRGQSGAHVTPWNVFFYDLNLALFGFEPRLHYAHLLALLVAGAWMLYVVLRLWVPARAALLGAAAFLLGKPLVYVGQELMAAHYATGLVFALLAVWCWVRGLERERWTLLIAGAVFYLLATTCKEVYVPLVALLPLIPVSSFRRRLTALWPFVVVALVYVAWRHAVLGQLLGGYSHDVTAWDPSTTMAQLARIPSVLAGPGGWGYVQILVFALFLLNAAWHRRIDWLLFFGTSAALLLPLVPLTAHPGIQFPDRYLFVVWAALSAAIALFMPQRRSLLILALAAALVTALVAEHRREKTAFSAPLARNDALYRFALSADTAREAVYAPDDEGYLSIVLPAARHARNQFYAMAHEEAPLRVVDRAPSSFAPVLGAGHALHAYSEGAMKPVDPTAARADAEDRLKAGAGKRLTVRWRHDGRQFLWALGPYPGPYRLTVHGIGTARVPSAGSFPWRRDRPVEMRVCHDSSEGWSACTPRLVFDATREAVRQWEGAAEYPLTDASRP